MKKADIAVIGGTGSEQIFESAEKLQVNTPYGTVTSLFKGEVEDKNVVFLPRHGLRHSVPPHKVNYKANMYALHKFGATRIIATNAVGAINASLNAGDLVIPSDFIDFTKQRASTFYDKAPVTHVDFSEPYCPQLRKLLIDCTDKQNSHALKKGVLVCTEGPRFETPAEIRMFKLFGCDIVGMTGLPEAVLARELGMCYASICYVSNKAAGMQQRLSATEVSEASKIILPKLKKVLVEAVRALPLKNQHVCQCVQALRNARFQ